MSSDSWRTSMCFSWMSLNQSTSRLSSGLSAKQRGSSEPFPALVDPITPQQAGLYLAREEALGWSQPNLRLFLRPTDPISFPTCFLSRDISMFRVRL